jgi:hypothetical protein
LIEAYLFLPPGIPYITSFGLIPLQMRLGNYAIFAIVACLLWLYGFTVIESLAFASIWITLLVYLVIDYFSNVPLAV